MKKVFEYFDFRKYLIDFLQEKKSTGAPWSHRYIQKKIGVSSSGYLSNVLSGKKNISMEHVYSLCSLMTLPKNECQYFQYLVQYNQAQSVKEREVFFKILKELSVGNVKTLGESELHLFSHWYYVAILELVECLECPSEAKYLNMLLNPSPGFEQVQEALERLVSWGFIEEKKGKLLRKHPLVSTGDDILSGDVSGFQKETIDLAREAIDRFALLERDISCLTLNVSAPTFETIKNEVRQFRKKLMSLSEEDNESDRVIQCNFQIFPLSRSK
jgi:uncharacterized protein (TIGR02147 family)